MPNLTVQVAFYQINMSTAAQELWESATPGPLGRRPRLGRPPAAAHAVPGRGGAVLLAGRRAALPPEGRHCPARYGGDGGSSVLLPPRHSSVARLSPATRTRAPPPLRRLQAKSCRAGAAPGLRHLQGRGGLWRRCTDLRLWTGRPPPPPAGGEGICVRRRGLLERGAHVVQAPRHGRARKSAVAPRRRGHVTGKARGRLGEGGAPTSRETKARRSSFVAAGEAGIFVFVFCVFRFLRWVNFFRLL